MREITSIEINIVIRELKDKLSGSYFRKFYSLGSDSFKFGFYKEGKNILLYCKLLKTINETTFSEESKEADPFVLGLRKRLDNERVSKIEQHALDRIVVIEFPNSGYKLIIEMFGKGNMILVNKENVIELCYKLIKYKERDVRPRQQYEFPKSESIDLESINEKSVLKILDNAEKSDEKLISSLSKHLNIGPSYLESIILEANLNPKGKINNAKEKEALKNKILTFFVGIKNINPTIYLSDNKNEDYSILPIKKYENLNKAKFNTLNELLDNLYVNERNESLQEDNSKEVNEFKSAIERQKKLVETMKSSTESYKKIANKIYENMNLINQLIQSIKERKKINILELNQEFKEIKIKEMDLKNKIVTIEFE